MDSVSSSFILHLNRILEDKIYFRRRKYRSSNLIAFPEFECKSYYLALLRLKPAIYYEYSKIAYQHKNEQKSCEKITLILITPEFWTTVTIGNQEENLLLRNYNDIARKYLKPKIIEGLLSLNIKVRNTEFSPEDFPHSWQNGNFDIFSKWSDPTIEERELEEWIEVRNFYETAVLTERNREEKSLEIVNEKKIFHISDCIIYKIRKA